MRHLTLTEIDALTQRQCTCEAWENILVHDDFSAENIWNVHFSGKIELGKFAKSHVLPTGETQKSGLRNARLHNCRVGSDTYIAAARIANYSVGENCFIENVAALTTVGTTAFGNGTEVQVLNEAGGREVKIFDKLSAHLAYILALYRHRPALIAELNRKIDAYAAEQSSDTGEIGNNSYIVNCQTITNIKIGENAVLQNVTELKNGTVCSDSQNPTKIENGVVAHNFIAAKGAHIHNYALVENCYVGEACEIGNQFSATHSLFFCNCQLLHGEAASVFAGPYTTSHHKSTLLIGCMFSFYNAGSGTNQSNHMYKLGPVHQGILERGTKTGSDSYMMLEARTAPFSLVLGHHEKHFDTSDFPFSYILSEENASTLMPALNLQTIGTQRDVKKWATRDKRKGNAHQDFVVYDLFTPHIVGKMRRATEILSAMKEKSAAWHTHKSVRIKDAFVGRGLNLYRAAIALYIGKAVTEKINSEGIDSLKNIPQNAETEWIDAAGLILPKNHIEAFFDKTENDKNVTLADIQRFFCQEFTNYRNAEWAYICRLANDFYGKSLAEFSRDDVRKLLDEYSQTLTQQHNAVLADAAKEFGSASAVSFGIDGDDKTRAEDFRNVRGTAETNAVLLQLKAQHAAQMQEISAAQNAL